MEQQLPDEDMSLEQILYGINSKQNLIWNKARLAASWLAASSPEQLLALTRLEARNYRKHALRGTVISLALVTLSILITVLARSYEGLFGVAGVSLACAIWLGSYIPTRARSTMIEILRTMDDPRFLGPLLTMLVPDGVTEVKASVTLNSYVRKAITQVLITMLPRVRQEHRANLSRKQLQTLMALLWQSRMRPTLTVPILRALQHIGDESTFPMLEALIKTPNPFVQSAAYDCLEYLRLHADARKQSRMLLRASAQQEEVKNENLLRPAMGDAEGEPDLLLRPLDLGRHSHAEQPFAKSFADNFAKNEDRHSETKPDRNSDAISSTGAEPPILEARIGQD